MPVLLSVSETTTNYLQDELERAHTRLCDTALRVAITIIVLIVYEATLPNGRSKLIRFQIERSSNKRANTSKNK